MRVLAWFRSDLRVDDQRALFYACRDATRGVVAVFVVTPAQWTAHDVSDRRVALTLRQLRSLSASLMKRRIPLRILNVPDFSATPAALLALADETECAALYFNIEYEVREHRRDEAVKRVFEAAGRRVRAFHDQVVVPPDTIRTQAGGFYTVFTPYRRAWIKVVQESDDAQVLGSPRRQPASPTPPDPVPDAVKGFDLSVDRCDLWPEGEQKVASRVDRFISRSLRDYHDRRDVPSDEGTSRLSPYLALGALSARRAFHDALAAAGGHLAALDDRRGAGCWITELIWREFYRHVLVGFPRVCMNQAFKPETERVPWRRDEEAFAAWCIGRTGVPIVDAGMRQLLAEGWMHNRVRMITAMYLTKDLLIDWRWGERHFMRHLVDGDFASNNGGWQWSASTGTDAAPYFRIFNPFAQGRRFDPEGVYVRRYVEELSSFTGPCVHVPHVSSDGLFSGGYPAPLVDHAEARRRALEAFKRSRGSPRKPR